MSLPAFDLPPRLEAKAPPEERGLARDEVRMLVASRADGALTHARFRSLPEFLVAGDVLVVNVSATVPAALAGRREDGTRIRVHFATPAPDGPSPDWWVVELRTADGASPIRGAAACERIELAGSGVLELGAAYARSRRLWLARVVTPEPLATHLARHGRPISYGYADPDRPLRDYQTVFALEPGSAEMPSAGRPFSRRLVTELAARGVLFAPLTLHTGVSSLERDEAPYPERYNVPASTARLIEAARGWGGRVIAVGTTAVRALETVASREGTVVPGGGWTGVVITPDRPPRVVDGLVTGWHDPDASHLLMLEAIAGRELLEDSYGAALDRGYLWHEFGDSHLILP